MISGYLITTIIVKDIEAGTFSFLEFYERRARRILPALFLVMVCCLPFAWMWMMPIELAEFASSVLSVSLFASNALFWWQSGYFESAAELKPLLHTWSLAVEEQYYIMFPVAVLFLWRFGRRHGIWTMALIAMLSLALSEYVSRYHPSENFYFLPTRAWELMAGGLCSFVASKPLAIRDNIMSMAGFIAIAISVFMFDETTPIPSLYALLPVLGTCAVLHYAKDGTFVQSALSAKPMVGLGLISYGAYLWHQPLFAFARIRSLREPTWLLMFSLSLGSIALAYLTWIFLEAPVRRKIGGLLANPRALFFSLGSIAAVFMPVGAAGIFEEGFAQRIPKAASEIIASSSDIGQYRNKCLDYPTSDDDFVSQNCHLGLEGKKIDFLLFGDSFAAALADGVSVAARQAGYAGLLYALHSCPPIIGIGGTWDQTRSRCVLYQNAMVAIVNRLKPKIVILNAAWTQLESQRLIAENSPAATTGYDAFYENTIETVKKIKESGASVYVVCCTPHALNKIDIPRSYAKLSMLGIEDDIRQTKVELERDNRTALAIFKSDDFSRYATLIDIEEDFCKTEKCDLLRGAHALFFDKAHLSRYGSEQLAPTLTHIFQGTQDILAK